MSTSVVLYAKFRTDNRHYVYDTYSNQILNTPPRTWDAFDEVMHRRSHQSGDWPTELNEAAADVDAAIKADCLRPCRLTRMAFYSDEMLEHRTTHSIPQVTLEITERCTNSCRYCGFASDSRRTAEPRDMPFDLACQAVDAFLAHSADADDRTIGFWGGEPLLRFEFIRAVVEYARSRAGAQGVSFGFTTNATLITKDVARFLAHNHFKLLVSLDGPQHIHDLHRRSLADRGTFTAALAGLTRLHDAAPDYYRRVTFNCVVAEGTSLAEVSAFFESHPLLREHTVKYTTAGRPFSGRLSDDQLTFLRQRFMTAVQTKSVNQDDVASAYAKKFYFIALRDRHPLGDTIQPNGCCVPLMRKLLVKVDGAVHICEQEPDTNSLGHIAGLDFRSASVLARTYSANSLADCSECWAVRLCQACYRDFMSHCEWKPVDRSSRCIAIRERILRCLGDYAQILEEEPAAFDFLADCGITLPV